MTNDAYYFHNVKATVLFTFSQKAGFDWLSVKGNNFDFYHNPETGRVWHTFSYFPISVTRNLKPWGYFDVRRHKLHIITRGDFENQLNSFVNLLKKYLPNFVLKTIEIKYVEICTRYKDKYFDEVSRLIKKTESRFFTNTKTDSFDKRIKGQTWLTLGRELSIEQIKLNIKTYRFVDEIKKRERIISESILPKIEVQLYKPKNLEEAKQIAIPLIKSFQKYVGFETISMDIEPDYGKIQGTLSLSHNQKLVDLFKENAPVTALRFPKNITQDALTYEIACFLSSVARTRKEIVAEYNINKSKLNRVLSTLNLYLEKRGNNAIGLYYQIDSDLVETHLDNNKGKGNVLTSHRVNNCTSSDKGNASVIEVSADKSSVQHPHIKVIGQKSKFKKVRITAPPQTVEFHNQLVNSAQCIGLNANNSTNQKLNIQALKGGE